MAEKKNMFLIIAILVILAILVFGLSGNLAPGRIVDNSGNAKSTLEVTPSEPGITAHPHTTGVTGATIKLLPPR